MEKKKIIKNFRKRTERKNSKILEKFQKFKEKSTQFSNIFHFSLALSTLQLYLKIIWVKRKKVRTKNEKKYIIYSLGQSNSHETYKYNFRPRILNWP